MSGNGDRHGALKLDLRVRRSRERLGDALVALMQEKPFDSIKVQDVLERAGVSRSTFYTHFSDKEDLLLADADEAFAGMAGWLAEKRDPSERVAPVAEFFAHVAEMRTLFSALATSGRLDDVLRLAQGHFARGIEQRLVELARSRALAGSARAALAKALAAAMIALLLDWLARQTPESPSEMDALFHALVWNGVPPSQASRS